MNDPTNGLCIGALATCTGTDVIYEVTALEPRFATAEQVEKWPYMYGHVVGAPLYALATIEPRFSSKQQPQTGQPKRMSVDVLQRVTPQQIRERVDRWLAILPRVSPVSVVAPPRYSFGELLYSRDDGTPIGWVIGVIHRTTWEYLIRQSNGVEYDLPEAAFMNEAERSAWINAAGEDAHDPSETVART